MVILIFLIVLSVLIFAHEFGHFIFAKFAGVKVDEFGFGYPPRMKKIGSFKGTEITLNWIPFGGFVKILGENYDEEEIAEPGKKFTDASKFSQIAILAAGVLFNFLLAWLLLSSTYLIGTPYPVDGEYGRLVKNPEVMITDVLPGSPAENAGLKAGDVVQSIVRGEETLQYISPASIAEFVSSSKEEFDIKIKRGSSELDFNVAPTLDSNENKLLIGVAMDEVGILKLGLLGSLKEGLLSSLDLLKATFQGLGSLFAGIFRGTANLSQVAGPVGLISLVNDAYKLGLIYLFSFTALISINLAVINLLPFPALDGGRILIVFIEAIKGSRVSPKIFNTINAVGFALLMILMAVVTYHDIARLF